jgi:hypothetical protein
VGSALDESLPVNSTDRTRVLWRLDGAIRNFDVSADLALLPLECTIPTRRFFAWPGKRNSAWQSANSLTRRWKLLDGAAPGCSHGSWVASFYAD